MLKKRLAVILSFLILIVQVAYGFGSKTEVNAASTQITDNIITSVTMSVYDNGVPVTDVVYKQGAEVKLSYDWALPDDTYQGGATYSFNLPNNFVLASDIMGTPLKSDGLTLGHFDVLKGSPNKVVMTFGDDNDIDKFFGVHGSFTISTKFDKASFTETTVQNIVFPIDGGNQTVTLQFIPDVPSTIDKSGKAVGSNANNLNAKQIAWTVDVNKVLSSVYGASVTDTLPAGLALASPLDVKVYELNVKLDGSVTQGAEIASSRYVATTPGGALKVAFNDSPITGAYRVQFTTDITDATKTSFTNNASFSGTGLAAATASATVNVSNGTPLKKISSDYKSATQVTYWEINYNYNEATVPQANAVLKDYFNNTQELVAGSMQVFPVSFVSNAAGVADPTEVNNYTVSTPSDPVSGKNGFELKFNSDINSAYKIKYQTRAINRVLNDETISNSVTSGTLNSQATRAISQVIINKSVADYNYALKTVKWSVSINGDSYPMDEVVVKDVFTHKGLKIVPGTIVVKQGASTITSGFTIENQNESTGFDVRFNSQITGPYTITYETYFNNKWLDYNWLTTAAQFENKAAIEWKVPGSTTVNTKTVTATFNPNPSEKANGFKNGAYNAVSKEITWTVGINYNRNPLASAKVTDTLTDQQKYVPGSVEIYELTVAKDGKSAKGSTKLTLGTDYTVAYTDSSKLLEVQFKNAINKAYYVIFKTSLQGELVNSPTIYNTANLSSEGDKESQDLTASLTIPKANEFVTKSGTQSNTKIKWSVNINYSLSYVEKAVLTDDPSDNQILAADSFKLYPTTVNAAGDITKVTTPLSKGTDYDLVISTDEETGKQQFVLSFKAPIEKAYILEYESLIVANNNDKVSNSVKLSGENSTTITKQSTKDIIVALSTADGVGQGTRKTLNVVKEDAADHSLLSGATFALYRKSGSTEVLFSTLTTDVTGKAVFKNLWPGSYVLQEIAAPAGYIMNSAKIPVTFGSTAATTLTIPNQKIATATPTATPIVSPTTSPTATPTPTVAPPATLTPTPTATATATPTATPTASPTASPTATPTSAPTVIPTPTVIPAATPTPTPVPDYSTPTPVTSMIPGVIVTPAPSAAVTPTATIAPSALPSASPTATPVQTPKATSTPAAPQATTATTIQDIPIEDVIPLGGVPSIGNDPAHGKVTITPDGKWRYTPDPGYTGKDKFTIIVTDEDGNEDEVVIEVDVDEVPKGTVTDTTGDGLPGKLPQTGEESPLPLYLTGGGIIILGAILARRYKSPKKPE